MDTTNATLIAPPMLDIAGVAAVCATTRKQAKGLLYRGQIAPAFDLRTGTHRFMRVCRKSVECYVAGLNVRITLDEIIAATFPQDVKAVAAARLCEWFNVREHHLYRLIKAGEIEASPWAFGAHNSARVNIASLIAFLKRRCISSAP